MSKLSKLRRLSVDELRVRGSQRLHALLERRGWSSLTKLPSDAELLNLLNLKFESVEQFFAHFHSRTSPRFFEGLTNQEQTAQAARLNFPDFEQQTLKKAERIVKGQFDLLGLRGLSFGDPIDWQLEPVSGKRAPLEHWSRLNYLDADLIGDKKIVWELNRHQYFVTLGQAYWLSGDERFAATIVEHLQSWMDQNPPKLGINWASSLEVSFRSISWLWAFYFFKDSSRVNAEFFTSVVKFLYLHAKHLETYLSTYFSPNTHLTGEALGLFYLGTMLPEFREAARWQEMGSRILIEQLSIHVQADGVYFEQSSYYHRYTADFYTHFLLLSRLNEISLPADVETRLGLLFDHLMYITRPDGTTPLFGDDDGGRLMMLDQQAANDFRSTLATGAALFKRADYKFVGDLTWHGRPARDEEWHGRPAREEERHGRPAREDEWHGRPARGEEHIGKMPMPHAAVLWLLGPQGLSDYKALAVAEPASRSKAFSTGGYYVMRDGWNPAANYLLIDCGPHGMNNCGHAHADALSFDLAARGQTLFVDPGTYTYTGSRELRDWFRGSAAHNTLTVDGQSSSSPNGPFSWNTIARSRALSWISRERFDYFQGEHDGYLRLENPATHARAVLFLKQDYWIVHDRVRSPGDHSYELRFHLDSGLEADSEDTASLRITSSRSGRPGHITSSRAGRPCHAGNSRDNALKIACFEENARWQREEGFVSHCYAEREEAPIFVFSGAARANADFLTFMLPSAQYESLDESLRVAESFPEVREVEAIGGRAFEIAGKSGYDVLMVKIEERAEMARLASDFEWTWARYLDESATVPEELVLIGGQWLELGGREVLRSGRRINYLVASRVGEQFRIETDDGVLQLQLPIADFESALKEHRG